jgi:hypothetical protein
MKQKLKDLGLGASLLPFVIVLCAIEMGGCDNYFNDSNNTNNGSSNGSSPSCYDYWVEAVDYERDNAVTNKDKALAAAATAKDTTKNCDERKAAAKLAKEKATAAKTAAEAAKTNADSTPSKDQ